MIVFEPSEWLHALLLDFGFFILFFVLLSTVAFIASQVDRIKYRRKHK